MSSPGSYYFGVEIELVATPRQVQTRSQDPRSFYFEKLAGALRRNGAAAVADPLSGGYRKHPEHYDKWWITKDGSLGDPSSSRVPLEAVSPILVSDDDWEDEVGRFWRAFSWIFCPPAKSMSSNCGCHVHVSPRQQQQHPGNRGRGRRLFSLDQLRRLAYGVLFFAPCVQALLPPLRRANAYCAPNDQRSAELAALGFANAYGHASDRALRDAWNRLQEAPDVGTLVAFIQGPPSTRGSRNVLWNFHNVLPGRSGTIEFRGAPGATNADETKRWIAFVVAFVQLCLVWTNNHRPRRVPSTDQFWDDLLEAAETVGVDDNLPADWTVMRGGPAERRVTARHRSDFQRPANDQEVLAAMLGMGLGHMIPPRAPIDLEYQWPPSPFCWNLTTEMEDKKA